MRLTDTTRALRAAGRKALVPFLTAGYPDEETFLRLLAAAGEADCPVIEVGIPFSDPVADGPVIQVTSRQALDQGMSLRRALDLIAGISSDLPAEIVLMSYVNPMLRYGLEEFAATARQAGVSGVILPDVPREEASACRTACGAEDIAVVDLIARTTSQERAARMAADAEGFLYLVSLTGVTGAELAGDDELRAFLLRIAELTDLPRYVGFGVAEAAQAAAMVQHADGVIVGSALLKKVAAAPDAAAAVAEARDFLSGINRAINASAPDGANTPVPSSANQEKRS